jgi:hypothetical protein
MELTFKDVNQACKFSKTHPNPVMCFVESGKNNDTKAELRKNYKKLSDKCEKILYCVTIKTGGKKQSLGFITFFNGEQIFNDCSIAEYHRWLDNPEVLKAKIKKLLGVEEPQQNGIIAYPFNYGY